MRPVYLLAAALASLLILASARIQAADSAELTGVVLDENGAPVGAVQIKFEPGSGKTYQAETDGRGRFLLADLPAGDYKVEVRKQGFFLLSGKVLTVRAGPNELIFTLNHAE
jgi:hypothetical protein